MFDSRVEEFGLSSLDVLVYIQAACKVVYLGMTSDNTPKLEVYIR